jgi:FimV-like protein
MSVIAFIQPRARNATPATDRDYGQPSLSLVLAGIILCGVNVGTTAAADLQKGLEAVQHGDYKAGLAEWQPLAEQGDARAQYNLAQLYRRGLGVQQDYGKAIAWYKRAANQGHGDSAFALAWIYARGDGAPQDYAESARWARLAAQQGHVTAQTYIGNLYAQGVGVPQDYVAAYAFFSLAAAQGDRDAEQNLQFVRDRMSPADVQRAQQLSALTKSTVGTIDPSGLHSYGPVNPGETLWAIAERTRPDTTISMFQMLLALLKVNPDIATVRATLKPGSRIKLPSLQQIKEVGADQAKAEILSQLEH